MHGGMPNQPKILRGAFVEFGISIPPLLVVFQFNPLTISRSRAATPVAPKSITATKAPQQLDVIGQLKSKSGRSRLVEFRNGVTINVQQQKLTFDIRLDATDKLNEGDTITEQFGISPQLSTLEMMMLPHNQSVIGAAVATLLGVKKKSFAFFDTDTDPPIILFIWGRKKILPVNILNMQIREEEFTTDLNPTRAVVTVSLEVIEGPNLPYLYSKTMQEVMSLLNLANIGDLANTIVPA